SDLPVAAERIQKRWWGACELGLRRRVRPQDLNATGQRVRETRDEQHIRRAGEDEAHGGAVRVDRWFKSRKQLGDTLDLVENCTSFQASDEAGDIRACRGERRRVVESVVAEATSSANLLRKRGLTAL